MDLAQRGAGPGHPDPGKIRSEHSAAALDALRAMHAARRPLCLFGHTHYPVTFALVDGRRQAVTTAVKIMGEQFVLGRTIEEALARARREYRHRFLLVALVGVLASKDSFDKAIAATESKDYVVATYREHGHALARGVSAASIMASSCACARRAWICPSCRIFPPS